MQGKESGGADKDKDESTTEKSEKEKSEKAEDTTKTEPEPTWQLLENPARVMTAQVGGPPNVSEMELNGSV